jgi:hypothetical protein
MMRIITATFLLLTIYGVANAAPFCLTKPGMTPLCIYHEAQQCDEQARVEAGVCTNNPEELPLEAGIYPFCVVTSQLVSECIYVDRDTCVEASLARGNSVCIRNDRRAIDEDQNNYDPGKRF